MIKLGKFIDITGQHFGKWVVLKKDGYRDGEATWLCRCACGTERVLKGSPLRYGYTTSCGCSRKENSANRTHGMSKTRLYRMWKGIRARCYSKNNPSYKNYGGRGIKMCEEWYDSFVGFRDWAIENGYDDNLTIERLDVNGDYEPNNCTFITRDEQAKNRRNTLLTANGVTRTKKEWAEELGVSTSTLSSRLNKLGWNAEDAVSIPVGGVQ